MSAQNTQGWDLRQFYAHPPRGDQVRVDSEGWKAKGTAALTNEINEEYLPRRIVEDRQLCQHLVNFVLRRSLPAASYTQHFHGVHMATERSFVGFELGQEARNVDAFVLSANYVREFVAAADGVPISSIKTVPCEKESGIIPNRKMTRNDSDRITVELKSIGAFGRHVPNIRALARDNWGEGTEITHNVHSTNERAIILKLGKHMISRRCEWAVLVGAKQFIAFYLKRILDENNYVYYHLLVSDLHDTFPGNSPNPICLTSVLIAMLLDPRGDQKYEPPVTKMTSKYVAPGSGVQTRQTSAALKK